MYLYFNKNGTLTTQINHGEVPRQGANLDVFALVDLDFFDENLDPNPEHWHAELKVTDSKGDSVISSVKMDGLLESGYPKVITFVKANNAEVTFNLINGQNYYAFEYLIISSPTGFPGVTALSGNIKIGVSFINDEVEDGSLDVVCGEATIYIEPVLNSSYLKNTINPSQYRQLIYRIEHLNPVSSSENNYSVAYNLVVNRNGYQFSGYKFADVTIAEYSDYIVKQLQVNTTSAVVTDLDIIKAYLNAITGHDRVPTYDEDKPSDEFVICSYNNTIWKLQYDSTNGLLAFKVTNIPLIPTKTSDLTNDSGFINNSALSGYATEQYVTQSCEELERSVYEDMPTATSDLTNDSGYQTQSQVQNAINNALTSVYKFQGSISVSDLNDYISSYTGNKNELNGWVFNITDSGNLTNSSGTTPVVAGDNVAFYVYNTTSQLYEWDKLAGTIDTSNFVNTGGTQQISGKKTFTHQDGIGLSEQQTQPSGSSGLTAYFYDNHLYWKGQKIARNSDITTEIAEGVPYLTTAPSSANTSGKLKFVVLSSEPSTYYDGYYYILVSNNGQ